MRFGGYAGRILYLDLASGKVKKEALKEEDIELFLGGEGINYRLAARILDPNVDPLSPENVIILGTGPLSGTIMPATSKISATTKFPLNGAIGSAVAGGRFSIMLKSSGYDFLVITGAAKRPVFLKVHNDEISLEDAAELWGKDIFETTAQLVKQYEPCSVICIGAAGENRVRISMAFVESMYHLGTGGLGAVMGSKNLKAIVACQGDRPVTIKEKLKTQKLVDSMIERMKNWPLRQPLVNGGMLGDALERRLIQPNLTKNWTQAEFAGPEDIGAEIVQQFGEFVRQHRQNRHPVACPSCPMACNEWARVENGTYAGLMIYGHFNWLFPGDGDVYGRSAKYFAEMNRHGMCVIDFNALKQLVIHLQEQGLLTESQVGFRVREDDLEGVLKLITMTAYREGFGQILADGLYGVAKKIPGAEKYLVHVKGRGLHPSFEPRVRGLGTNEFTIMTNPRGAHIATGGSPSFTPGRSTADFRRHAARIGMPAQAIERVIPESGFNPGRFTRYSEDWVTLLDCLGLCNRHFVNRFYHIDTLTEIYNAVSGRKVLPADMLKAAERSWNLCRLLNNAAGFTRENDLPPAVWFTPLKAGKKEAPLYDYYKTKRLNRQDIEKMLDQYYEERGWNPKDGRPTQEKLQELQLDGIRFTKQKQ
jgi:aldehyde:ferredoxin oxidoreductase